MWLAKAPSNAKSWWEVKANPHSSKLTSQVKLSESLHSFTMLRELPPLLQTKNVYCGNWIETLSITSLKKLQTVSVKDMNSFWTKCPFCRLWSLTSDLNSQMPLKTLQSQLDNTSLRKMNKRSISFCYKMVRRLLQRRKMRTNQSSITKLVTTLVNVRWLRTNLELQMWSLKQIASLWVWIDTRSRDCLDPWKNS